MRAQQIAVVIAAAVAAVTAGTTAAQASGLHTDVQRATTPAAVISGTGYGAAIRHVVSDHDDQGTLVLVKPQGGITTLGQVSDDADIEDVSNDAREVVTARSQTGQTRVTVWDTKTHTPHYFRIKGEYTALKFAGHRLIASSTTATTLRTTTGSVVRSYRAVTGDDGWWSPVISPTGAYFALSTSGGIDVVRVSDGSLVRKVAVPKGYATCDPMHGWDSSSFVMTCTANTGYAGDNQPFRAGYTSTAKSAALAPSSAGDVRNTSPVRVNQSFSGGCVAPAGYYTGSTWHQLPLSKTDGTGPSVVGGVGSSLYLLQSSCSSAKPGFVQRYDLKTKRFTNLAGTAKTGGGIITQAVMVDGR
ncbi:hypothetical protein [Leekyejoonella antrihumi]|uniref:Uncharacterized protein n=1 Tax=Leekyejoonella antrihumi TaxID=1660198 RepID=A0A563E5F2_9MICO|nr:hypothetical protein [Leekyejoonella antrihumi]TWP37655.1 hypothetical protein FGL98_05455 [Leekyejoonella antrihumi]